MVWLGTEYGYHRLGLNTFQSNGLKNLLWLIHQH